MALSAICRLIRNLLTINLLSEGARAASTFIASHASRSRTCRERYCKTGQHQATLIDSSRRRFAVRRAIESDGVVFVQSLLSGPGLLDESRPVPQTYLMQAGDRFAYKEYEELVGRLGPDGKADPPQGTLQRQSFLRLAPSIILIGTIAKQRRPTEDN